MPEPELSPLAIELASLRADNDLFARPATAEDSMPSLFDSGYLLPLLPETDRAAEDERALNSVYRQACGDDALWATWSASRLSPGIRQQLTIDPTCTNQAIAEAMKGEQVNEADIAQTAAISEALLVIDPESMNNVRSEMIIRITSALTEDASAYLQIRAREGLRALGASDIPPLPSFRAPEMLERTEDVMDLWAVLTTDDSESLRAHARDLLAPIVQQPSTEGREFDLAYAIPAWALAEGDPAALDGLLDAISDRVDPITGLIATGMILTGTLDSTYDVARAISAEQFAWIARDGVSEAVQALVPTMLENRDALGLLKAAFVFQQLGRTPESADASSAGRQMLEERLGEGAIPVSSIGLLVSGDRMLDLLGQDRVEIGIQSFEVTDDETLYLLYSLLPYADSITDGQELFAEHAEELDRLPVILENPDQHPVQLLVSALGAAPFADSGPAVNVETAFDYLKALRGCDGYAELFRAEPSDTACVLQFSADALELIDAHSATGKEEGKPTS